ncbi:MAG: hypothetical protein N2545_02825, partial [Thermoflexales bacterium]|nr:hypothetical protein [Thermoflexales bacterium]
DVYKRQILACDGYYFVKFFTNRPIEGMLRLVIDCMVGVVLVTLYSPHTLTCDGYYFVKFFTSRNRRADVELGE